MIRWEYKVFDLLHEGDAAADREEVDLDAMGKFGWKLVAVVNVGSIRRRFYMKRRILPHELPPPNPPPPRRSR